VFGDIKKLNDEVEVYLNRASLPSSVIPGDKAKAASGITLRKLTPARRR
jgi:hypothetical protein